MLSIPSAASLNCHFMLRPLNSFLTTEMRSVSFKQSQTAAGLEQLQKLFSKSKPNRQTPEQLDAKIEELERQRTTTSVSLAEEKSILRQIDQIKKSKIQIEENVEHERAIQDKKTQIEALRTGSRSMTAQIAELENAISKIDLAERLGCTTNDLQTCAIDCPVGKLGEVIGKGGTNIKQLEKRTGCIIDVDKVKGQVHLRGDAEAIKKGIEEIENITHSVEDEIRLTAEVHTYLFGNVSGGIYHRVISFIVYCILILILYSRL